MTVPANNDVAVVAMTMDRLTDTVHAIAQATPPHTVPGRELLWHPSLRLCEALLTLTQRLVDDIGRKELTRWNAS